MSRPTGNLNLSFENGLYGILCVNVSECICLCTMHIVTGEVQVEQLMSDSIINLRGPSKSSKDKLRFPVSNISYKAQDTNQNTSKFSII